MTNPRNYGAEMEIAKQKREFKTPEHTPTLQSRNFEILIYVGNRNILFRL